MDMKRYQSDIKLFANTKIYIVCLLVVALLAYGFAAVNGTVGIDDLESDRYAGSGNALYAAGRFATVWWATLLGYRGNLVANSFVVDIVAVLFLCYCAVNFCILFRRIMGDKLKMAACTVFSCMLVSYPLMNEIWEYTGANLNVCGGFLLVSFALLLIHGWLHGGAWRKPAKLIIASLLMMLVCAGYESLAAVYVFFVFALLALQAIYGSEQEKTLREILRQGMIYAAVLVMGLLLRAVVHRIILITMQLEAETNGATKILWGTEPAGQIVKNLILDWVRDYLFKGIIYFPLTELAVAGVVFFMIGIVSCRKYGWKLLLPGLGMLLSLVLLSIVQGKVSPYRTCQVFAAFVAFTAMLVVNWLCGRIGKHANKARVIALLLCGYLCFHQAVYMNYFLSLNHIRSEEEAYVIREIGTELEANYPAGKPVIFVGRYELCPNTQEAASISENDFRWSLYKTVYQASYALMGQDYDVTQLSRKLPQTNVNSVIEWGWYSYGQEAMQNLFAYYGCDYVLADYDSVYDEACQYAAENKLPSYPQKGYIADVGEYLIVCVGTLEE